MQTGIVVGEGNSFSFWKNVFLMIVFFTITPITLGISLFSIFSLQGSHEVEIAKPSTNGVRVYASLPSEFPTVNGLAISSDARPKIIKNYLEKYNSPLLGNENYIVSRSDEVGLDFRLITAIAQQESNLCKIFPEETYNCWGWGIHSKGTLGFASYNEAIDAVTYGLKTEYIDKGLTTPDTIWKKYTPSSPDGAWAKGVNQFMSEME
ncbi:MAG: hypothetical protein UR29_C0009G0014 [Candidatus Woesebacteria bacterium GW2011_GWC2_33_12]|uniref:Mannosyl-glycoprotein endo-beta-N-acetylglucosamidase-like domain-containing protein n=1 Tax=Candidatus Woesebacteria bacterium GW2011_GWB1_33_22 TaxID=1618566 RepID=A0A0G0A216_9BACT|nr:MAG: hypothetical protein UR29_C0009G0014 [Candidatus Woesebacteria bacterium GW2011_GWC2_33_12]KKP42438.1 MAG: hypothetical protein UR33_C0002G0014 [Candidatus Woesebacteria bacterium GW2011_GWA2_33_20]KKP45181.1 MAG: hypothetical protein UR35_C0002G0014 [Candidatus Woesebacteria bacterium GW2011_GWB1_33_22]KKP46180.1 MAG: hypothetical protein UR37_C0011G0014 [Microgenomates group bacterium GW2011_GWC1_33_28]KKP50850.1 MAG: hypothetical protein UR41_C0002G0014 [Candidatus Woesebacteria bact